MEMKLPFNSLCGRRINSWSTNNWGAFIIIIFQVVDYNIVRGIYEMLMVH